MMKNVEKEIYGVWKVQNRDRIAITLYSLEWFKKEYDTNNADFI